MTEFDNPNEYLDSGEEQQLEEEEQLEEEQESKRFSIFSTKQPKKDSKKNLNQM